MSQPTEHDKPVSSPTKVKKKSHGLCRFMTRKKKITCCPPNNNNSEENISDECNASEQQQQQQQTTRMWPEQKATRVVQVEAGEQAKDKDQENSASKSRLNSDGMKLNINNCNNEDNSNGNNVAFIDDDDDESGDNNCRKSKETPIKSESSTNFALCCAMTESSKAALPAQSEFKKSISPGNDSNSGTEGRQRVVVKMTNHRSEELPAGGNSNRTEKKPVVSDSNIASELSSSMPPVKKTNGRSLFAKYSHKCHKRSFSLGKSIFSSGSNGDNVKDKKKPVLGSSLSCDVTPSPPAYSLSPSPPATADSNCQLQPRRRRAVLLHRRSVDNIVVAGSSDSSPGSPRVAAAKQGDRRMRKSRPSSVAVMGCHCTPDDRTADDNNDDDDDDDEHEHPRGSQRDVSMDSLARQSLFAAHVLHLIPTNKARERNFLHGRIAAHSLLGTMELDRVLPQREIRIYIGTWNMNGRPPPPDLNALVLPEGLDHLPDVLAVGTQESYPERFLWEVSLQETLGPSHVLFHSAVLGTLHLAVYIRRDLLFHCSVAEEASFSVRTGSAFRTKGAVAIGFSLFGSTLLFVTSHLTAHQDKVKERLHDVRRIVKSLDLPKALPIKHRNKDVTQNFDYVFWCGDLNFRLVQPREEVMEWLAQNKFPLAEQAVCQLSDQLTVRIGDAFPGFKEGPLTFAPTYKYDPGTQTFDTSHKQRTPSYTDRILFKCRRQSQPQPPHSNGSGSGSGGGGDSNGGGSTGGGGCSVECLCYTSVPSVCTSDHKPVWGLYRCSIRPGIDTIPLAAGLFNREVYLEAIKRRAAAMEARDGASAVCSLQ